MLTLCGSDLTLGSFVRAARDPAIRIQCSAEAVDRVEEGRKQIERIVEEYERAWEDAKGEPESKRHLPLVYGITTGFGKFKTIPIPPQQLRSLQRNLLLSHSAGVGIDPNPDNFANYFPAEVVRGALILRLNAFLLGHSGVRLTTIRYIEAMLNCGIVPLVPLRGSLGASGDLCPLAHVFALLLGQGRYYVVHTRDDVRAPVQRGDIRLAENALANDLRDGLVAEREGDIHEWPYEPSHKEGLALTNGLAFSVSMLALAVHDSEEVATTADVAAAMGFEAVGGRVRCLDEKVHRARGLMGQQASAANLRALLAGSQTVEQAQDVQDVYSLRCAPQVHGAARDAIAYARLIVDRELNAATDNPLFFPGSTPWDLAFSGNNRGNEMRDEDAYSAGNFHGQPIGLAADFLAVAVAELANISERRTQMLLDDQHNRNLPASLIPNRGSNSGLMIAQYCAASLVSENKVLAHPATVDSIPTSANTEDHVSMSALAARKLRDVLNNVEGVLAIELLCAAQAIDWRVGMKRTCAPSYRSSDDGRSSLDALQRAHQEVAGFRRATTDKACSSRASFLGRGTGAAYLSLRRTVAALVQDAPLDEPIRRVWELVRDGSLLNDVRAATEGDLADIPPLRYGDVPPART